MIFTVVGAGAIGALVGAYLSRSGHRVKLVDVAPEHVRAINTGGLTIEGLADFVVRIPASLPAQLEAPLGTVILAVKGYDTEAALSQVISLLSRTDCVVAMQNGLEISKIARGVGPERTVGASFTFGGHYVGPGRVAHVTEGAFAIGELDGRISPRLMALQQALSAIQKVQVTDNIVGLIWAKMAMASMMFGTALVDDDVPTILDRPEYRSVLIDLTAEAVTVAGALGIKLAPLGDFDPRVLGFGERNPQRITAALDAVRAHFENPLQRRSGIWRDLAVRKRKTEATSQLGELLDAAEGIGIAVPRNRAVYKMIGEIESGRRPFSGRNLEEAGLAGAARP